MNKTDLAVKIEQIVPQQPALTVSRTDHYSRPSFSESDLTAMRAALAIISDSKFEDTIWDVRFAASGRHAKIKFPPLPSDVDSCILKATTLYSLINSGSVGCRRYINDSLVVLDYFASKGICIETCSSGFVDAFVNYLDSRDDLSSTQKNNIIRALARMLDICNTHGLMRGTKIVDCGHRWIESRGTRRAPENCVMLELDSYFFDLTYNMPLVFRTLYLLLRFILNRIDEVLSMDLDCLGYPCKDVFSIAIPTMKETPYHIPEVNLYNRKLPGDGGESILYDCIYALSTHSLEHQQDAKPEDRGYLFIQRRKNGTYTVVKENDFNVFLAEIIKKHGICDSEGKLAKVTSHHLRHVGVKERMEYGVILPYEAMNEANHSSLEQTMKYGQMSKRDEAKHLAGILSGVFESQFGINADENISENEAVKPFILPEFRFNAIIKKPNTKILPGGGGIGEQDAQACAICTKPGDCKNGFEKCFKCEYFHPDPKYIAPIEAAIADIDQKIKMLEKKSGNPDAIKSNKKQLKLFKMFLEKCDDQKTKGG